ncbi:MAG: flagellar brake protein YcgR [Burkholderiales bacterium]|nr:MAG: flagellar brake protein YcgR [Burkholderiales bacterium]
MDAEDQDRYRVDCAIEVAAILQAMAHSRSLVTAWYGGGSAFALTAVLEADAGRDELILDQVHEEHAPGLLASHGIQCTGTHNGVEIRFVVESVEPVLFQGVAALRSALPVRLLRLQRREYFRVVTPAEAPVTCMIPAVAAPIEAPVLDISCGGLALWISQDVLALERGTILRGCRLRLPHFGTVEIDIRVVRVGEPSFTAGVAGRRCGCAFVGMGEGERKRVQRYIIELERCRNSRLSGLR